MAVSKPYRAKTLMPHIPAAMPGNGPDAAQVEGFQEKLGQEISLFGAQGPTDADFSRAFGHGHQHDVHDAQAAHQQ